MRNRLGDDVRPDQKELDIRSVKRLTDQWGKDAEPLLFPFEQGQNTITLRYINQPLIVEEVAVVSYQAIPSYSEARGAYTLPAGTQSLRFEAEDRRHIAYRSDATVSIGSDGDPLLTPFSAANIRLNILGGYSFRKGGQEVCWEFEVPEAGLYAINLRALQSYSDGLPVYRTVKINGAVPFEEMLAYELPYDKRWNSVTLCDGEGEPYLLCPAKGAQHPVPDRHPGRNRNPGGGGPARRRQALNAVLFDITRVTGQNPDANYDYQLDLEIPDLFPA